jgi:tetratricopeptide (TPR) repeat protein
MESSLVDSPIEDEASGTRGRYSRRELAELSRTSPRRINAWIRAGLLAGGDPGEAFGFHQVRTASLLAKLTRNGIGTARLKRIIEQLGRRFPNPQEAISQLELFAGLLVIRDDDRLTAPDGQLLLDLLLDRNATPTIALRLQAESADECANGTERMFERAVALEQAGDLDGAARAYRECLLQSGPDAVTCFNLANVLEELGQTEAACERYCQVVELDPQYASAWNNLGLGLAKLGQPDDAIEAWRRAVEIDPDCADAVFNLADALQQAKCWAEARPCWEAYLRLVGDSGRSGRDSEDEWMAYARFCLSAASRS